MFAINPALHYTTLEIPGARSFGVWGYGDVQLIREHKLAVKTIKEKEWFAVELIATLLVGSALYAPAAPTTSAASSRPSGSRCNNDR